MILNKWASMYINVLFIDMVKSLVKTSEEGCPNLPSLLDLNELGFKVRILSPRVIVHPGSSLLRGFRDFYRSKTPLKSG